MFGLADDEEEKKAAIIIAAAPAVEVVLVLVVSELGVRTPSMMAMKMMAICTLVIVAPRISCSPFGRMGGKA